MIRYVTGFLFDTELNKIVLISKLTPETQYGKVNGVGGKIEKGETPLDVMVREFREEAGIDVPDWKQFCTIQGPHNNYEIFFFYAVTSAEHQNSTRTMTAEQVFISSLQEWPNNSIPYIWKLPIMPNMHWLIPMALTCIREKLVSYSASVHYGV